MTPFMGVSKAAGEWEIVLHSYNLISIKEGELCQKMYPIIS